jgi:hypothetical protein
MKDGCKEFIVRYREENRGRRKEERKKRRGKVKGRVGEVCEVENLGLEEVDRVYKVKREK